MGYRSTVYLGINKEQKKEFNKLLMEHDLPFEILQETETHLIYFCGYLKWYEEYRDVSAFNKMIRSNVDNFCVAVGEDHEIHSDIGDWYDHMEFSMEANVY